jgi:hypothetical protein
MTTRQTQVGGGMDEVEFIKLNFADAIATVRAYDTKSQIVLASTAFSFTPIVSSIRMLDATTWLNFKLAVVFIFFAAVFLMFVLVLAPVTVRHSNNGRANGGLFFIQEPTTFDPEKYLAALSEADLKLEYAVEILALHRIRATKTVRFNRALIALVAYIVIILMYGFSIIARAL